MNETREWINTFVNIGMFLVTLVGVGVAWWEFIRESKQPERTKEKINLDKKEIDNLIAQRENLLVVFQTKKQTTTLIFNEYGLSCWLYTDGKSNMNKELGNPKWKIPKTKLNEVKDNVFANPNYKPRTGLLNIGNHKKWLYSKGLFPRPDLLEKEIRKKLDMLL